MAAQRALIIFLFFSTIIILYYLNRFFDCNLLGLQGNIIYKKNTGLRVLAVLYNLTLPCQMLVGLPRVQCNFVKKSFFLFLNRRAQLRRRDHLMLSGYSHL